MNNKIKLGILTGTIVATALTSLANADQLYRQLQFGMSGSDVGSLQTFLAADPTIYPQGRVTGYFGFLTKSAVSNFQARNGIASIGRVGPQTLAAINAQMNGNTSLDMRAPTISNVTLRTTQNSATIGWSTDEMANGIVYFSTQPLTMSESETDAFISGNTAMTDSSRRMSQSVVINNLQSNTTYYYALYTKDASNNVTIRLQDTLRTN